MGKPIRIAGQVIRHAKRSKGTSFVGSGKDKMVFPKKFPTYGTVKSNWMPQTDKSRMLNGYPKSNYTETQRTYHLGADRGIRASAAKSYLKRKGK